MNSNITIWIKDISFFKFPDFLHHRNILFLFRYPLQYLYPLCKFIVRGGVGEAEMRIPVGSGATWHYEDVILDCLFHELLVCSPRHAREDIERPLRFYHLEGVF